MELCLNNWQGEESKQNRPRGGREQRSRERERGDQSITRFRPQASLKRKIRMSIHPPSDVSQATT